MSGTFLDGIMRTKREEQAQVSPADFQTTRKLALEVRKGKAPHTFLAALRRRDRINIIAEVKRSSPSVGVIANSANAVTTAKTYEQAGAAAVSVLTEPQYFKGSLDDLREVAGVLSIPILRKDFTVSAHQIYEAAVAGASAVLLIVAGLSREELISLRQVAEDELGMDALVEVHAAAELEIACAAGASIVGVNNRDLQSLAVTLDTSRALASSKPQGIVMISESGLKTVADVVELHELGYDGFLMGETLMRAASPGETLRSMVGAEVAR